MESKIDIQKIQSKKPIQELLEFSIINLDKPAGPTSFVSGQKIKYLLGLRKTSHFGTLDPIVTGVLPVGLNRACKLSDFFMHKDKVYIGEIQIHKEINESRLREEMKNFIGKIMQKPPVKSRVKREFREREIKKFEIMEFDENNRKVKFIAEVQAGTYIRKLISDLGEKIGGAHMAKLRRIKAGLFEEKDENFVTLEKIEEAVKLWKEENNEEKLRKILIPAEIISQLYPVIQVKKTRLAKILNGKPLIDKDLETGSKNKIKDVLNEKDNFVCFCGDRFVGVYRRSTEGSLSKDNEKSKIVGRAEFVFS